MVEITCPQKIMRSIALILILLLFSFNISAQKNIAGLQSVQPSDAGLTTAFLQHFTQQLNDSIPCLGSFLIWRNGGLVYEKYFHDTDSSTAFDIKSITKSVVSALAGIAKAKGLLPDLNTPVVQFFPEFAQPHNKPSTVWFSDTKAYEDSMRNTLTLYDLLTMQHGWDWSDFGAAINIFINAQDPVRFTFDIPFADTPGTRFIYSSAAASLFGAALEKTVHTNLKDFATTNLLQPAGMHCDRWDTDPEGRTVGCSEMYLTARNMMRFGLLYLHNGRNGDMQVIPSDWITVSTAQHAVLNYWDVLPHADGYGYYWWRRKTHGHQAYVASGAGGQIITVIPDLNMVAVATCLLNEDNRGRSEIKRLHIFVDEVTAAVK
jgi:CubicO group peptidase (beta-lactamase class C family)